ncbi:hypothetical protein ACFTSF_19630 [Kribbella sp. NPDC056951]|uniref:hypothetical protein n=1 Tax=Kribbella sp. NPDC056951 TaxID=3345978 RepID=UPI00363C090B
MRKIISGVAATIAAGGVVLGGAALHSSADTAPKKTDVGQAAAPAAAVKFKTRYFTCVHGEECTNSALVPSTWRYVEVSEFRTRFVDKSNQSVYFDVNYSNKLTTAQALKNRQKALKGTKGLKVLSTKTMTMKSTSGSGPLTVSTIVYTYKSGKTTRWVANRYIGSYGSNLAGAELTVAGVPANSKFLGTVLLKATTSLASFH